jgi:NarL family two-component system sensor histidine kinase YdfH
MILHIALHWLSGFTTTSNHLSIAYLGLQGGLGLMAVLVSGAPELTLAIFATMIGETIGVFGTSRLARLAVAIFLVLTPTSYFLIGGQETFENWLSPTISTMIILIIFMVIFRRQLDASERAQVLASDLETANHQLVQYAAQVEALTLTTERQRMARELHDTLAQGVAGLVLQLEAADAQLERDRTDRAQAIIQQSMKRARTTLADARAAIDDLRLEHGSLAEVVQHQVHRFTQATGIPCHLVWEMPAKTIIPPSITDHTERLIGESLTNITHHAQARNVWLKISQSNAFLTIDVEDDGVGFDVNKAIRAGHYGLLGMRERTRLVNGTFEVNSSIQNGTRLSISIPLEAK